MRRIAPLPSRRLARGVRAARPSGRRRRLAADARAARAAAAGDSRAHRGPLRRSRRADRQARRARSERRRRQGARADRARPLRAGRVGAARRRGARAPASEAALELGLLQQMLGTPRRHGDPRAVSRAGRHEPRSAASSRGRRARCARSAASRKPTPRIATPRRRARAIRRSRPAWGELFLEKHNKADALKSFQMALQADPRWTPALLGAARALADDNPPQAVALAKKALEINPSYVDAHVFLAERGDRRRPARRSARGAAEGARGQPVEPRGARAASPRSRYVEDKPQEFEAEVAKALAIAPSYGDVYRVAGELAAHNYRFDEAVDADAPRARARAAAIRATLADLGMHLLRTGDEPARADGARGRRSSSIRYNSSTFNLLSMMDTLDKFVTVRDGDVVIRLHKDEAPVLQEYAMPLAHQALEHAGGALRVHAEGPDPHRDLPEARRLRGPERRPARHDRRARRLLRPRRDDGLAAGAAAGRVPVGSDALARAGARRSRCRCRTSACRGG